MSISRAAVSNYGKQLRDCLSKNEIVKTLLKTKSICKEKDWAHVSI